MPPEIPEIDPDELIATIQEPRDGEPGVFILHVPPENLEQALLEAGPEATYKVWPMAEMLAALAARGYVGLPECTPEGMGEGELRAVLNAPLWDWD